MRIVKDPDERREEILHAAIKVFIEKGYDKTSITDIAKEINISQGLCYRYFPSKEAIYDEAIEQYASYIANKNISITPNNGKTLKEQVLAMNERMGEYFKTEQEQSDLYELFHKKGNHKLHDQLFLRVADKLIPYVTEILKKAKERGEINFDDTEIIAYFLVYGQMGILMDKTISNKEKSARIQSGIIKILGL